MRTRALAILLPVLVVLAVALALLRPGEPAPRASVPDEFGQLTEALRTYDTLYVAVGHHVPPDGFWRYLVYASGDGRVVVDFYRWSSDLHWFWNGNRLLEDERDAAEIPPRAADVEFLFAELVAELRSGLANTTIEIVKPPPGGSTAPDIIWGKLSLPFDWAGGIELYVGLWNRDFMPKTILLDSPALRELYGGKPLRLRIVDFSVNVPVPKGTFSMQAAEPLCLPSRWLGKHFGAGCIPPHDPGKDHDHVDWKRPDSYPASAFAKGGKCRVEASDRAADAASPRCP